MTSRPQIEQTSQQSPQIIMNLAMKRAFHVLQLPVSDLSHYLESEIEKNPLLEKETEGTSTKIPLSHDIPLIAKTSMYTHLMHEISYHFDHKRDKELAFYIAGNLDEKGFLTLPEDDICLSQKVTPSRLRRVLNTLQHIEPIGMGARDVREAFLIQLRAIGKKKTLIYKIVEKNFSDLNHNHLERISKSFNLSILKLKKLIADHLKPLTPFPGHEFSDTPIIAIIPDIRINREDTQWTISVEDELLPSFRFHTEYVHLLEEGGLSREDVDFMRRHIAAGKWLRRTVNRRQDILRDIGSYIIKKQGPFLDGIAHTPAPMSMIEVAKALMLSPSTITRAIANKYLACPRGTIKIRDMFTQPIRSDKGVVSNQQAKDLILQLIKEENKAHPLSDQQITQKIKKYGILCARRTVAKYRKALQIATATKRREVTDRSA